MHTSAWQLSLDVLMLISACFGFSTEDPMIQISAFRFPARSGSTPRGHRIVFFRVFFSLKNPSLKKYDFWLHLGTFSTNFIRISSILDQILVDFGPFSVVFCCICSILNFQQIQDNFWKKKWLVQKHKFLENHRFTW